MEYKIKIRDEKGRFVVGHLPLGGMKDKKHSKNTKEKIAFSLTGKKLSEESIKKRTETRKRLYLEGKLIGGMKGKKQTEATRIKISASNINRKVSEETKRLMSKKYLGIPLIERWGIEKYLSMQKKRTAKLIGKKMHENTRIAIHNANTGRKLSQESINKIIRSHKGKHYSPETEITKERRAKMIFPVKDTSIEIKIQDYLKQLEIDFYTHQYISQITHAYQCDILIEPQLKFMSEKKTIIECDGDWWHGNPIKYPNPNEAQKEQIEEDACRNEELRANGFNVIRLWETDIRKMSLEDFKIILIKSLEIKNEKVK